MLKLGGGITPKNSSESPLIRHGWRGARGACGYYTRKVEEGLPTLVF